MLDIGSIDFEKRTTKVSRRKCNRRSFDSSPSLCSGSSLRMTLLWDGCEKQLQLQLQLQRQQQQQEQKQKQVLRLLAVLVAQDDSAVRSMTVR
jgi:hypothetical protein